MFTRILWVSLFVLAIIGTTQCDKTGEKSESKSPSTKTDNRQQKNQTGGKHGKGKHSDEDVYYRMFQQKRAAHVEAVKTIIGFKTYEKQYQMVSILTGKIFKVMSEARVKLMEFGYGPGDNFPVNETIKQTFSLIAENTAFFGDILLRLPDITHDILRRNKEGQITISWAISFLNESKVFEGASNRLLNLMAQELNLVERDPNYVNPYKEETRKYKNDLAKHEADLKKKEKRKKKKEKKKRGPKLSGRTEL